MKATREQCLAMAMESGLFAKLRECEPEAWVTLVHLAQQFTLDQLRCDGGEIYVGEVPYWRIPETLK